METMVSVGEGVLLLKVTQEMMTDYVFKDFAGDRCEGDWAVVLLLSLIHI